MRVVSSTLCPRCRAKDQITKVLKLARTYLAMRTRDHYFGGGLSTRPALPTRA